MRKFYRRVVTIEILSEDEPPEWEDLADLEYLMTEGHCSGRTDAGFAEEVTPAQMAKLLIAQGSDPEFFSLTEDGEDLSECNGTFPPIRFSWKGTQGSPDCHYYLTLGNRTWEKILMELTVYEKEITRGSALLGIKDTLLASDQQIAELKDYLAMGDPALHDVLWDEDSVRA